MVNIRRWSILRGGQFWMFYCIVFVAFVCFVFPLWKAKQFYLQNLYKPHDLHFLGVVLRLSNPNTVQVLEKCWVEYTEPWFVWYDRCPLLLVIDSNKEIDWLIVVHSLSSIGIITRITQWSQEHCSGSTLRCPNSRQARKKMVQMDPALPRILKRQTVVLKSTWTKERTCQSTSAWDVDSFLAGLWCCHQLYKLVISLVLGTWHAGLDGLYLPRL